MKKGKHLDLMVRKNWQLSDMVLSFYPRTWHRARIVEAILRSGPEGIARDALLSICPKEKKFNHDPEKYLGWALNYIVANESSYSPPLRLDYTGERLRFVPFGTGKDRAPKPQYRVITEPLNDDLIIRKYGGRGEGGAHKRLKQAIAGNADLVGLGLSSRAQLNGALFRATRQT